MANHKAVQATNGNNKRQVAELSDFDREMLGNADAGISDSALDNIIPQIKVLQPLSPEIVDGKVEGARAGDFLIAGLPVRGSDGVWFQPCAQAHRWFEFKPIDDGGGFVAEHPFQVNASGDPIVDERGDPIPPR
ncbi:MAG TPA: hypothetical protein VN903_34285, partial [Polyangia bacterium]|nr:hypothetical protein [Polyangia bacterium]